MEDFSAPSFSLGLDDSSAPSFSLGLDLDLSDLPTVGEDEEEEEEPPPQPPTPNPTGAGFLPDVLQDFDEDPGAETLDPDLGNLSEDRPPVLKRLRRGPPPCTPPPPPAAGLFPAAGHGDGKHGPMQFVDADDEIEEFSPPKEHRNQDESLSLPSHASCSNSKASLHCRGVLTSQSARKLKQPKISPAFSALTSASFEASSSKKLLPKLTISPLRKFCLVDSDSDDPSSSKDKYKDSRKVDASLRSRQFISSQSATRNEQKTTLQHSKIQTESFWNDFNPKKNTNLETPVLDEFCEEYFRSVKNTRVDQCKEMSFSSSRVVNPDDSRDNFVGHGQQKNISRKVEHSWNLPNPQPPAYRYFYHDDARIRALVRERFRYFFPLGSENHSGYQQSAAENLDYMNQFGTRHAPTLADGTSKKGSEGSSKKRGKKPNNTNAKVASRATGGWVNPKSSASIPKDAGKRRVCAGGQQSGQWFTGQDGKKVYVTKDGQELTGRIAYRSYKKDTGGFRKSRKKAAGKKRKR